MLKSKGGVLIEFAFGIPILILMLYFCFDVPSAYRLMHKLNTSSRMAATMLMNINMYKFDKRITAKNLEKIVQLLGIYFSGNVKNQLPYNLSLYVTCVKGTGGNGFSTIWSGAANINLQDRSVTSGETFNGATKIQGSEFSQSAILNDSLSSSSISDFQINAGEIKFVVETFIWYDNTSTDTESGNTARGFNTGFYMLKLPLQSIKNRFSVITMGDTYIPKNETEQ